MMARGSSSSSPKVATVSQVCETGCSSRLYRRILNFGHGHATKRLVSNTRHSNIHAIENGNSGSRQGVLTTVDQKSSHNHTKVSSKRKDNFGCKSISCVKTVDQVAKVHQGNGATNNKVAARNFIKGKYICKDGEISQPHQLLDALQIYYSNKQLFLKLVQGKTSLSVKDQYQAGQKMLTRSDFESKWINSQRSHETQCETPSAGCHYPLHSPGTHGHNVPSVKHSYVPFSHTKRKLRHAMGVRKKCGDEANGMESVGRKSASSAHSGYPKEENLSLDFKEREKTKIRNFMLCRGQNDVSVHERCGRNMIKAPVRPSLQNIQNTHLEDKEYQSEVLNCRIDEQNNDEPQGDDEKSPPDNNYAYNGIITDYEEFMKSGHDLHPKGIRHVDDESSDQDRRDMDNPTQSSDADITSEENGSVMESPNVVEYISFSPEVSSSSSSSSCQTAEDAMDMTNMVDDSLRTESTTEQVICCSSDQVNNLITSTDTSESNFNREILQALSLKWDELVMNYELPDQLIYPSTLEELKGLTNQLSDSVILFDYVMEVFKKYQNLCRFPHHISVERPNVQAYVLKRTMVHEVEEFMDLHYHQHYQPKRTLEQLLEQDLDRRRSWLNVQDDIDDIATEVQEDVLQELIFEIISEKDSKEV